MSEKLLISAIGSDRPGIVEDISNVILEFDVNILDSRMSVLGGEFAIILLTSGDEEAIGQLTANLTQGNSLNLTITCKRTAVMQADIKKIPYNIEIITLDQPGIVNKVAKFFSTFNVNIEDWRSHRQRAAHTGVNMYIIDLVIGIPANISIADLKNNFFDFCDNENLDAEMEPLI